MEGFDLSDCGWSTYACDDVFDAVSSAEFCELRDASSSRIELGSSIRQDLGRLAVLSHGFFQEFDRMLRCWVVMNP